MKQQLPHTRCTPHLLHVIEQFNAGILPVEHAAAELDVSRATLFRLRKQWLNATRKGEAWTPGKSGGNHHPPWPDEATAFLRHVLAEPSPYAYAFAASEMERLHDFRADRAQVRRWALKNGLARHTPKPREPAHCRRFQRAAIGELWQLDATPDAFLGPGTTPLHLLDMLDDCSRLQLGGVLYRRETLAAYIHFLKTAFETHGLPLQIYVDGASFFKSPLENGSTKLKNRLRFYDISFIYANTPEAKGKVERLHQVWQNRLPAYFAKNGVPGTLDEINRRVAALIDWRNRNETHRETGLIAADAWAAALSGGRSRLRARPACPWWDYIWATVASARVLPRRRVRLGAEEVPVNAAAGACVYLYTHADGTRTVLQNLPQKGVFPVVLYTDRPRRCEPPSPPAVSF